VADTSCLEEEAASVLAKMASSVPARSASSSGSEKDLERLRGGKEEGIEPAVAWEARGHRQERAVGVVAGFARAASMGDGVQVSQEPFQTAVAAWSLSA